LDDGNDHNNNNDDDDDGNGSIRGSGCGFVQAFKVDLKSYCICEHGSKLCPAQSTRWNIIATSCTMNFSFPQVLPILVIIAPHPPVFLWEDTAIFVHAFCEAHLYIYITPV
jgi:hypothetical protein